MGGAARRRRCTDPSLPVFPWANRRRSRSRNFNRRLLNLARIASDLFCSLIEGRRDEKGFWQLAFPEFLR
jgi:hypothetical protein